MAHKRKKILLDTCSYLNNLIDNLEASENLPYDSRAIEASKTLTKRIINMQSIYSNRTNGNIVLISEKLMILLGDIKTEINAGRTPVKRYYCDLCIVDTTDKDQWSSHINNNHVGALPETLISCNICGLFMYGIEKNLLAYINSPSHKAVDQLLNFEDHSSVIVQPHESIWRRIKKYGIVYVDDVNLQVYDSMKTADTQFKFRHDCGDAFLQLFDWIKSCFLEKTPLINCYLCGIHVIEFSASALLDHLASELHLNKSRTTLFKKGFLVCLDCVRVDIHCLQNISSHKHPTKVLNAKKKKASELKGSESGILLQDMKQTTNEINSAVSSSKKFQSPFLSISNDCVDRSTLNLSPWHSDSNDTGKTSVETPSTSATMSVGTKNKPAIASPDHGNRTTSTLCTGPDSCIHELNSDSITMISKGLAAVSLDKLSAENVTNGSVPSKSSSEKLNLKNVNKLTNIFNYLLSRYTKEAFCLCCPTLYFCTVCNFSCSYLPYWNRHLNENKHTLNMKNLNHSDFIFTSKCSYCGLLVYINRKSLDLLDLPLHKHVDLVLNASEFDENAFKANCRSYQKKLIENDSSLLTVMPHNPYAPCKEDCLVIFDAPPFIVQNVCISSLMIKLDNFFSEHLKIPMIKLNSKLFTFVCYSCSPILNATDPDAFISHLTESEAHKMPIDSETTSGNLCKLAGLCNECSSLLTVWSHDGFQSLFSIKDKNQCQHKFILKLMKKKIKNSGENNNFCLDEELCLPEVHHKRASLPQNLDESFKLIFNYLSSRFTKEPFCRDCGTYYFCAYCCYGTSYMFYWDQHLSSNDHKEIKSVPIAFEWYHCSMCGLTAFANKDVINLLDTPEHRNADTILKSLVPEKNDFLANCKQALPKVEARNSTFLSLTNHTSCCKLDCKFTRLFQSAIVNDRRPFVLVNFNLIELRRKLKSYMTLNSLLLSGKMRFHCLNCTPISSGRLMDLEDHLMNNHSIASHKCGNSSKCMRIACLCCVCNTLIISLCTRSNQKDVTTIQNKDCKHETLFNRVFAAHFDLPIAKRTEYILNRIEKHLINSGFKCSYLKGIITYFCCICSLEFKTMQDLSYHISLPGHTPVYQQPIIFFCYNCNKVNVLSDLDSFDYTEISGVCMHFYRGIRSYKQLKMKQTDSNPIKDNTNQMKCLPDVNIGHSFQSGNSHYFKCPIISSYEIYNLSIAIPDNNDSQIQSIKSSPVLRDPTVKEVNMFFSNKQINSLTQYDCLICCVMMKDFESFYTHLDSKKHAYFTYMAIKLDTLIPLMVLCQECSQVLVAADLISLDSHYQSIKHANNCCKQKSTTSLLEDHALWNSSTFTESSLAMFHSQSSFDKTVAKLNQETEIASKQYKKVQNKIGNDILSILSSTFPKTRVYFFGSRETGLAKKDSDIDIFVDLDGYYMSECKRIKNCTTNIANLFRKNRKAFEWTRTILEARVPLVKLWHRYYGLSIDLNCLNSAGTENTKLLRFYLDYDDRCRWLVMVLKEWANINLIHGRRYAMNSYMIVWMVFFFLMQPEISILPNVNFLKSLYKGPPIIMNGWDYSLSMDEALVRSKFKPTHKPSRWKPLQLLKEFFNYYSNIRTKDVFLCPLTGKIVPTAIFNGKSHIYYDCYGVPVNKSGFKFRTPIVIMDPFVLNFNLTKNIHETLWAHYQILCLKMLLTCKWLNSVQVPKSIP